MVLELLKSGSRIAALFFGITKLLELTTFVQPHFLVGWGWTVGLCVWKMFSPLSFLRFCRIYQIESSKWTNGEKKYWSGTNSCVGIHARFQVSDAIVRICFHMLETGLQTKIYMLCLPAVLFLYTKPGGKKILELEYDLLKRNHEKIVRNFLTYKMCMWFHNPCTI